MIGVAWDFHVKMKSAGKITATFLVFDNASRKNLVPETDSGYSVQTVSRVAIVALVAALAVFCPDDRSIVRPCTSDVGTKRCILRTSPRRAQNTRPPTICSSRSPKPPVSKQRRTSSPCRDATDLHALGADAAKMMFITSDRELSQRLDNVGAVVW